MLNSSHTLCVWQQKWYKACRLPAAGFMINFTCGLSASETGDQHWSLRSLELRDYGCTFTLTFITVHGLHMQDATCQVKCETQLPLRGDRVGRSIRHSSLRGIASTAKW